MIPSPADAPFHCPPDAIQFMVRRRELPPIELLRERFTYDPATGLLRRARDKGTQKAGDVAGCRVADGYVRVTIRISGKPHQYSGHRIAWALAMGSCPASIEIDHINGVRNDNRLCNLRAATRSQNTANTGKIRGDLAKGVRKSWNRFEARVCQNGKRKSLGIFDTEAEAAAAYAAGLRETFGEYGRVE